MTTVSIDGHSLTLGEVVLVARQRVRVNLADSAREKIRASRAVVEQALEQKKVIYGLTTGFGLFKKVTIKPEQAEQLQKI